MRKLMRSVFIIMLTAFLLTGCGKAVEGQEKEEAIGNVVVGENAQEEEEPEETESAELTDEPDTTEETLKEEMMLADFGEKKRESALKYENIEITFQVEQGYYSQFTDTDDYWACEYFLELSELGTVDCYLEPVEEGENAQSYIENELQFAEEDGELHMNKVEVKGHLFYYYIIRYEYNGSSFQKMLAVSDVETGYVYVVRAGCIDGMDEMKQEDFESFFHFEIE